MTEPLDEFRKRYDSQPNIWWMTECGDHMNLFDAACERIDDLEYRLRAFKTMLDRETRKVTQVVNAMREWEADEDLLFAEHYVSSLREALRVKYPDPPDGWEWMGTHANDDPVPELRFSIETDDGGLPLWEQVVERPLKHPVDDEWSVD